MFSIFFETYHSGCYVCKVAWWALARGAAWSATLGLLQTAKSHRLSDGCLVLFLGLGISRQGPATSKCDATDATAYTVVNWIPLHGNAWGFFAGRISLTDSHHDHYDYDPWWSRFWNIPDWIPFLILCEGVHLLMPAEVFVSMQLLIVVSVVPGMWHCIWVRIQPACKRWDMVGWCFACQFS